MENSELSLYKENQAHEEANILRVLVRLGKAKDYAEAEKIIESQEDLDKVNEEIALENLRDIGEIREPIPVRFLNSDLLERHMQSGYRDSSFVIDQSKQGLYIDIGLTKNDALTQAYNHELYELIEEGDERSAFVPHFLLVLRERFPAVYEQIRDRFLSKGFNLDERLDEFDSILKDYQKFYSPFSKKHFFEDKWGDANLLDAREEDVFARYLDNWLEGKKREEALSSLPILVKQAGLEVHSDYITQLVEEYYENGGKAKVSQVAQRNFDDFSTSDRRREVLFKKEDISHTYFTEGLSKSHKIIWNFYDVENTLRMASRSDPNQDKLVKEIFESIITRKPLEQWSFNAMDLLHKAYSQKLSRGAGLEQIYDLIVMVDPGQVQARKIGLATEFGVTADYNVTYGVLTGGYEYLPESYYREKLRRLYRKYPQYSRPIYHSDGSIIWPKVINRDEIKNFLRKRKE